MSELDQAPCTECGELTAWVMRLDCTRPDDPPAPFWCCPRCSERGRFRRRNRSYWMPEMRRALEREEQA